LGSTFRRNFRRKLVELRKDVPVLYYLIRFGPEMIAIFAAIIAIPLLHAVIHNLTMTEDDFRREADQKQERSRG
jgi:hypothetical protein